MITVGYDARPLEPATRHWGVGAFVDSVLERLTPEFRFVGVAPRFPRLPGIEIRMWPRLPRTQRAAFELSAWLAPHDIFWGTCHNLPQTARRPSVVTVHDLLFVNGLDGKPAFGRARLLSSVRRARVVAANSESTARELAAYLPDVGRKIRVIPHGFSPAPAVSAAPPGPAPAGFGPFLLMLGCHRPRKNPRFALDVVARARSAGLGLSLVVAGDVDPVFQSLFASAPPWVHRVGVVPRTRLGELLRWAVALAFPSLYEGFGLPILEAMAAGCPVLGLDTASNREVGGAAALLSTDPERWVLWARDLMAPGPFRAWLQVRGFENIRRFSWERTAAGYAAIFRCLGGERPGACRGGIGGAGCAGSC